MKSVTECEREDKDSLFSFIERVNTPRPRSKAKKALWCVGFVFLVAMCVLSALASVDITISWSVCVLLISLSSKWVYFLKTEEMLHGLNSLVVADWRYMEMWFNDRKNQLFIFGRIMRSPAFILVVGFYYKLKIGDNVAAEKLLALARGRDPELEAIEMMPRHGLHIKDVEVLMEKIRRDLGVTWIYKLKQKKGLWATGYILLILLFVIRHIMILIDSGRLLRKGLAE